MNIVDIKLFIINEIQIKKEKIDALKWALRVILDEQIKEKKDAEK